MERGKVSIGDAFKVKMEMTERKTKRGYRQDFKIIEVLEFLPTTLKQAEIVWEKNSESKKGD